MASETTKLGAFIAFLAAIAVAVLGAIGFDAYQKLPNLEQVGDIDVYADHSVIHLRTTSSVPMVVRSIRYRLCDGLEECCAAMDQEEAIRIDSTDVPRDEWQPLNIRDFQVTPDSITAVPIRLQSATPRKDVIDLMIQYGDGDPPRQVLIHGIEIHINPIRRSH